MKKILLTLVLLTATVDACIEPIKPIPPIGCSYNNALLVHQGNQCYWVYVGC